MKRIIVTTESGNVYTFWVIGTAHSYPTTMWRAMYHRDHDVELGSPASGVVLDPPIRGVPLTLAWVHPERGPQLRVTTPVKDIRIEEDD